MPTAGLVPPLKVFVSYSHVDRKMCERFLVHLSQLKRDGLIAPWSDRLITAGADWAGAIDENLNSANIIVLLVSPDFLASDYCNDVEMDRALERDRNREACVVPVILKPGDWKTSRFAKLQATPSGGKPVVDWPTWDHGFDDVVTTLRKLIAELTASPADSLSPPVPQRKEVSQPHRRRRIWQWVGIFAVVVAALVVWWLWSTSQRFLNQGITFLNDGRYADAQPSLEQAKKWNPLSATARCGLEAIRLAPLRSDTQFKEFVVQASNAHPNCAYLRVLSGDQKYLAGDLDGALAEYQKAVNLEPRLAEAQFDLGHTLDLTGQHDEALGPYKEAVKLSPGNPVYHNNLAELYFRRGNYDDALKEYANVGHVPLSALNAAAIFRLQNKLADAAEREVEAIRWLQQPGAEAAEQGRAWNFYVSYEEQRPLASLAEKLCYAELELAVTRFLQGDESVTKKKVPVLIGTSGTCETHATDLKDILKWELRRLSTEVPQLTKASDVFAAKFLGG